MVADPARTTVVMLILLLQMSIPPVSQINRFSTNPSSLLATLKQSRETEKEEGIERTQVA